MITTPKSQAPTPQQRIEALRKLILSQTATMFGDYDAAQLELFSKEEWQEKGENEVSGEGAALTMFIGDSRWCDAINGYGSAEEEDRANKMLDKITAKLGFDWDLGGEDLLHFWFRRGR